MKLNIPDIGDRLQLLADWTFDVMHEHRNEGIEKHLFDGRTIASPHYSVKEDIYGLVAGKSGYATVFPDRDAEAIAAFNEAKAKGTANLRIEDREVWFTATLPAGTELTVDRIYIRKGAKEFSSLSFYALVPGAKKRFRFWVRLSAVNEIECERIGPAADTRELPVPGMLMWTTGNHIGKVRDVPPTRFGWGVDPLDAMPEAGARIVELVKSNIDGTFRIKSDFAFDHAKHGPRCYLKKPSPAPTA